VIAGPVTGPASDPDQMTAPLTRVVGYYAVGTGSSRVTIVHSLGAVSDPFYVRVRGTDGKRTQAGYYGAAVDPSGPAIDVLGNADPWNDLWFYANPIFVLPR